MAKQVSTHYNFDRKFLQSDRNIDSNLPTSLRTVIKSETSWRILSKFRHFMCFRFQWKLISMTMVLMYLTNSNTFNNILPTGDLIFSRYFIHFQTCFYFFQIAPDMPQLSLSYSTLKCIICYNQLIMFKDLYSFTQKYAKVNSANS